MSQYRIFFTLFAVLAGAQSTQHKALSISLCELYTNPKPYSGRMIQVRATIVGYRAPELELPAFSPSAPCTSRGYMRVALLTPNEVKPKPAVELVKDETFQRYEQAFRRGMRIEATLEGQFDAAFMWQDKKRIKIGTGGGFGKNHFADARLILRKISDLQTAQIPGR